MKNTAKKLLSLLLCLVLVLSFFPAAALAEDAEEPAPLPEEDDCDGLVRVEFICDPADAVITVYSPMNLDENGEPEIIDPEEDGSYLLWPGEYLYDAEREGYISITNRGFVVESSPENEAFTLSINLSLADTSSPSVIDEGWESYYSWLETPQNDLGAAKGGTISSVDIEEAIAYAYNERETRPNYWKGYCAAFVWAAYNKGAGIGNSSYATARQMGDALITHVDSDPPRGALVFWYKSSDPYNSAGHVGLSIGDGKVIHAFSSIKVSTISSVNSNGYTYRGWGAPIKGYTLETEVQATELTLSGAVYPNGHYDALSHFGLRGIFSSPNTIVSVNAYIKDSNGQSYFSYNKSWNKTTYNIQSDGLNDDFLFGQLSAGFYNYFVEATDSSGKQVSLSSWFSVGNVQYTITYDANGGVGSPASQTKTHDVDLCLSSVIPTRSGYSFVGWSTVNDATTAQYQPGDLYSNNANETLYAVWASSSFPTNYPNTWTNTGNQATDIAEVAYTQIGYTEAAYSSDDQNHCKYNYWYYGSDTSAAWCAIFVSWCANQAGIPTSIVKKYAVADPDGFGIPSYRLTAVTPQKGDIVFIENNGKTNGGDYGYDHVGIVYAVDSNYIYTVEGNDNDRVTWNLYYRSTGIDKDESSHYIYWVGRPNYTTSSTPTSASVTEKLSQVAAEFPSGTYWTDSFDDAVKSYGFAGMVIYRVFGNSTVSGKTYRWWNYAGESESGMVTVGQVATCTEANVKDLLKSARPGDILQFNKGTDVRQHSMVIYSLTPTGLEVYECNWTADPEYYVGLRELTFQELAARQTYGGQTRGTLSLLTSDNWDSINGEAYSCSISYNATGGTGAPSTQTKAHATALTLSSTTPSRASSSAGSYTVTLNANGGSVSTTSLTAARTTSYSFKNWNTSSNGSGLSYAPGASYTVNASATLYAQWNSSTSTAAVTLPTPTRTGYTFKGWATSSSATSGTTGSYTPSGNVTLYAIWQANTYTININANGGTSSTSSFQAAFNGTYSISPNYVYRAGYYLQGWHLFRPADQKWYAADSNWVNVGWFTEAEISANGYVKQIYTPNLTMTVDSSWLSQASGVVIDSFTIYAIWQSYTSTFSFNPNGGAGSADPVQVILGDQITFPGSQFSRDGYSLRGWLGYRENDAKYAVEFEGWFTQAELDSAGITATVYPEDLSFEFNTSWTEGIDGPCSFTMYAIWEANSYAITYDANGGTGAPAAQTKTHDVALTLSTIQPTRADETAGSYTVLLDPNGGSVSQDTLTAARTTSYTFNNWNTAANGSGTTYASGASYTANAAATLYAQWNSSTTTAAVTLPTPTREGFTFKGWATSASATSGTTGSYTPTDNVTLYAVWEQNMPETDSKLVVGSGRVRVGQEIQVPVRIEENPGVVSIEISVHYDETVLEWTAVTAGEYGGTFLGEAGEILTWYADDPRENETKDGVFATLTFRVKDDAAAGTTQISVSYDEDNIYNADEENQPFQTVPGEIEIFTYIPGDINGDGIVSNKDLTRLQRYLRGQNLEVVEAALDVNGDGKISNKDATRLQRYLKHGDVEIY
ncbi:MAG: InlB B-repeat-containing protein [Oscillospiraceae bacterium]|nr:InlB B-repeat-containing protein [Oscillospiraceae bacterium]